LYDKMKKFSEMLVKCGEGGFSNEIVRKRRTYGGFTANTGKAVSRLGVETAMLGMFGKNRIDSVFGEFTESSNLVSVGEPAISQIYEFPDGKIMLPYIQEIMGFNWHSLTEAIDADALKAMFMDADIIALGYWSLLPAFDDVVAQVCGRFLNTTKQQRMFFDLADIRKRDRTSLEETLKKLAVLNQKIPMTLSLNEHEAALLFSYYGQTFTQDAQQANAQTESVRNAIGLDELVVHTPHFATSVSATEGYCTVTQHYCENPVITTGAGDNFNGGYLAALLKKLPMAERLTAANATTGFYVSHGYSPSKTEMLDTLPAYEDVAVYK